MPLEISIERGLDDAAIFEQQNTLDGVSYTLEFRWNVRWQSWFFYLFTVDRVLLLATRIDADWWIGAYLADRQPDGLFIVRDTGAPVGSGVPPGFEDFGVRHKLWYYSSAELVEKFG